MASMNDHVAAPLLALLAPAPGARGARRRGARHPARAQRCRHGGVPRRRQARHRRGSARALVATHAGRARLGGTVRQREVVPVGRGRRDLDGMRAQRRPVKARAGVATAGDSRSGRSWDERWTRSCLAPTVRWQQAGDVRVGTAPAGLRPRDGRVSAVRTPQRLRRSSRRRGASAVGRPPPCACPRQRRGARRRCAAAAASRADSVGLLEEVARRGELLDARAFVHWYERHGCPADAIADALEALEAASADARWWHGVGAWRPRARARPTERTLIFNTP